MEILSKTYATLIKFLVRKNCRTSVNSVVRSHLGLCIHNHLYLQKSMSRKSIGKLQRYVLVG